MCIIRPAATPVHIPSLKQLHDDLDTAVLEAYGWSDIAPAMSPADILARGGPDAEALEQAILTRLVALNHERAAEEKRGLIRWLRPDFQCGGDHRSPSPPEASIQEDLAGTETPSLQTENLKLATQAWPEGLPEQVAILRKLINSYDKSVVTPDPESLAACFGRKNKKRTDQITGILATLKALGLMRDF